MTYQSPQQFSLFFVLSCEGFRLFFLLSAIYAVLWPSLWVFAFVFDLPLVAKIPPSLWHAHEMLVGAFGAALIGFLTTAVPEWTDTKPLKGRALWTLAIFWGLGRSIGLLGWDGLGVVGAIADVLWVSLLITYLIHISIQKKTERLLGFVFWLLIFTTSLITTRYAFLIGNIDLATKYVHILGFSFLGMLGLALARITVPITNLVLDPTEETSPFRPHPGKLNLASGLLMLVIIGEIMDLSNSVSAYIFIAAGAAFMDRVSEAFIGRRTVRSEILMLGGAAALAGIGLIMIGLSRLWAPWTETSGLHVSFMGGLGMGVYAVFCISTLLHTERPLGIPFLARLGSVCLLASIIFRVLPDFGIDVIGEYQNVTTAFWAGAFILWTIAYWPMISSLELSGDSSSEEEIAPQMIQQNLNRQRDNNNAELSELVHSSCQLR